MAKAIDVATFLIKLAEAEEEPDRLSHLRLQKLLYYAQGWSLALRKKPLFTARIEAWAHGPVVPAVYRELKLYKSDLIPANEFQYNLGSLSEDECELVEAVWNAYKKFSAIRLREMTHQEPPWIKSRDDCKAGELCESEITRDSMKKYFQSLAKK